MNTPADTINISILINTPVHEVWNAWTDSATISQWFGSDPNGKVLDAKLDVRPGGKFEISFANADEAEFTCSGVYAEVREFTKLSFTWSWKNEPGVESFVTVLFAPEENKTRMKFQHAHVGTASQHDYGIGWRSTFLKLEKVLEKKN